MKELTIIEAKKLFNKYVGLIKDSELREFVRIHSLNVSSVAKLLAKNKGFDVITLEIASLVHDLGYSIQENNHAIHSLDILKNEGFEISKVIEDCVLNHGRNSFPATPEGEIFRFADKLSVLDTDLLRFFLNKGLTKEDVGFYDSFLTESKKYLPKLL